MKKAHFTLAAATVAAGLVISTAAPVHADTQKNKNLWRNLAIGAGVIAGHGLITHNGTETLVGAAGAAYSANRYEQDRKHQSQQSAARREYYRSSNRKYYNYHGHRYYMNLDTGARVMVW